jgi:hypothetical protein
MVGENLRHEFHSVETRVELHFKGGSSLTAVWPAPNGDEDVEEDDGYEYLPEPTPQETYGFFYLRRPGGQPRRPKEVRDVFPEMGVVPILTPIEHKEEVLTKEHVRQNVDGRLASRHFRNHLYWIEEFVSGGSFEDFSNFCAEWLPEIELTELSQRGNELDVYYKEAGSRVEKEVFWAGDGVQVWLQVLFHLYRLQGARTVVLDEPDVYLRADLQRRLVRLLESRACQTITATHSAEVLGESSPGSVVWIDRARRQSVRAPEAAMLSSLSVALGTQFNLRLARALRTHVALFVEGDDMKVLRNLARTAGAKSVANETAIAEIPLQGFSHWEEAEAFSWLANDLLEKSVRVVVVLDRDYRDDEAVHAVVERFAKLGVHAHVWRRKELESYLLVPDAIARLSGADPEWARETLAGVAENLKPKVFSRMHAQRFEDERRLRSGVHIVSVTDTFQNEFESLWGASDRVALCPAKDVLRATNLALQAKGLKTVSAWSLSRQLRASEIDPEVAGLLDMVEELASTRR